MPWYAANRDLPSPPYGAHRALRDARRAAARASPPRSRDGRPGRSSAPTCPTASRVGDWVAATRPRGLKRLLRHRHAGDAGRSCARGDREYLAPDLIPRFDLYLSFTGGPTLRPARAATAARRARGPSTARSIRERYRPLDAPSARWDLGYLGTYSADRQPTLERLLLEPARRCAASGASPSPAPQYPRGDRLAARTSSAREHLPPRDHPAFYAAQRFTLNVTRADMVRGRLVAERAPVRGRGLRRAGHQRRLGRARPLFTPGRGDPARRDGRRRRCDPRATAPRSERRAIGAARARRRARRAHRRGAGARAGGAPARSAAAAPRPAGARRTGGGDASGRSSA